MSAGAVCVGRFAPSPSGQLHRGSMLAAIASYLDARSRGGRWLLRLDDLDTPRNEPGAGDAIIAELRRVGLRWDGLVHRQTETPGRYQQALKTLRSRQLAYPCGCSRKALVNGVYPGHCRNGLAPGMRARSLRFRADPDAVTFTDAIQGACSQCLPATVGDFVVLRADQVPAYHLATVVDDALAGVTHVVRGADLLESTARQIALQRALGLRTPRYAHLPVLTNAQGQKLSKQNRAPSTEAEPAHAIWEFCLKALGQPWETAFEGLALDELAARAARAWSLQRVPCVL